MAGAGFRARKVPRKSTPEQASRIHQVPQRTEGHCCPLYRREMTEPLVTPGNSADSRRAPSRGCAFRLLVLLSGLLAVAALVLLGLWLLLLSPYGYTPPADAPGFDEVRAKPVFVYGTLRRPAVRRLVIGRAVDTREAALPGFRKERLNIIADPQALIEGELMEVEIDELRRLDRYERLGVRYERLWLPLADGSHAWVYRRLAPP
jgi:gamma-glutamylcyclotransferase (GGCT)/AIG2-like uncharacterized protein YtfP